MLDDLRRLADDEDARVRAAAVRAIGLHAERTADGASRAAGAAPVEAALGDEPPVALAAVEALRASAACRRRSWRRCSRAASPRSCARRWPASAAHGDAASLERLLPLVSHPDWAVRAEAIEVLAERRVAKAVPAILRRLEIEQDDFVRDAILRALERLEG